MTTYAIIASALYGNKGASSMLEATLQLFDDPNDRFVLLSTYPDEDRRLNRHERLEVVDARPLRLGLVINPLALLHRLLPPLRGVIRRIDPAVDRLADADVLLDQGGITFSDGREKFLIFNVATILPAMFLGVPVVKCAQAIGPFENRLNRFVAKQMLPRVERIVARGARTREMLDELGMENVTSGVDLAFALETTDADLGDVLRRARIDPSRGQWIGVCPSEVARGKVAKLDGEDASTYPRLVAALIDDMVVAGFPVVVVPHSTRPGVDAPHNNDLPLCRQIMELVASDEVVALDHEFDAQELRLVISACDVLVTSRFHGMVSALAVGVPPLVLGWGHKYREVLDDFSMSDAGLDTEALLDGEAVRAQLELVIQSIDERRSKIAAALPKVRGRAAMHRDVIDGVAEPVSQLRS